MWFLPFAHACGVKRKASKDWVIGGISSAEVELKEAKV